MLSAVKYKERAILLFLFTLLLIFCFTTPVFAKDTVDVHTGYNIVFVVDNSGSLNQTDPARLRLTGLSKILSWLPGTGSRAGLVIFSTEVESYEHNLRLIQNQNDVKDFSDWLPKEPAVWTNITDGLSSALTYFNEDLGTDPNLTNLIVLFSDGNIELPNKSDVEPSRAKMLQLADQAKSNGIEIATVALNNNGKANVNDMQSISSPGLFIEVTNAQDLENAFVKLHESKFKADITQLKTGTNNFWVKLGSSALNLNIEPQSANDDFILTSPMNKKSYTKDSPEIYQIDGVYILNLTSPIYGQWKCKITDGAGSVVKPVSENFLKNFIGDVVTPLPSGIILLGITAIMGTITSKSGHIVFMLGSFVAASCLYALVFFSGALFSK